jgi:HEPN domain-containing protein
MPLSRTDFQKLAEIRIAEAGVLIANGMWDGAYYLSGYAVECGLKACIMAFVERSGIIFEDKKYSEKCWTHDLKVLVNLADLAMMLDVDCATDLALDSNWEKTTNWNETKRYMRSSEIQARELYTAISEPTHGVLQWIRKHW